MLVNYFLWRVFLSYQQNNINAAPTGMPSAAKMPSMDKCGALEIWGKIAELATLPEHRTIERQ